MNSDLRRSKRYNDFLPVWVITQNGISGEKDAGPFSGRVVNISRHGACLLLPLADLDSYEIYRKASRNDSSHIVIKGTYHAEMREWQITARPVWMDPVVEHGVRAYMMGVEFMTSPYGEQMDTLLEDVTAR